MGIPGQGHGVGAFKSARLGAHGRFGVPQCGKLVGWVWGC